MQLSGLPEHHRRFIRICMLFLKKRAQHDRCEWTGLSRQMRKTLDETTSLVVCNVAHPVGICSDAASYKYVVQGGHSVYVSESLGPGQLARHRCCMWHRASPRYPKSVRTVVVERCDVNFTPTRIGHYARGSLQLEACDNFLYEVNGVYEVTVGKKALVLDVLQANVLAVCASSSLQKHARLLPKATLNHQWLSADRHASLLLQLQYK